MAELKTMTTQIPTPLFADIEKIAQEQERSKSWILRQALQNYVSQYRKTDSQETQESKADRQFKNELLAMIQEAHDSGEDMNFEPPSRENIWKSNPILELADEAEK